MWILIASCRCYYLRFEKVLAATMCWSTYLIKDCKQALASREHMGFVLIEFKQSIRLKTWWFSTCLSTNSFIFIKQKQRVKIGRTRRDWLHISKGMPQGSVFDRCFLTFLLMASFITLEIEVWHIILLMTILLVFDTVIPMFYEISWCIVPKLRYNGLIRTSCEQIRPNFNPLLCHLVQMSHLSL